MDCHSSFLEIEYNDKKEKICGSQPVVPTINIPAREFRLRFRTSPFPLNKKGFVLTFVTKKYAGENSLSKHAGK